MRKFYLILLVNVFICCFSTDSIATNDTNFPEQRIKIIQCYPNPATSSISFETNNLLEKNLTISVYNFIGKKVDEIKVLSNKINLQLDNYYRGLYVYQLRDKQGQIIESGKFQVIK